MPPTPFAFQSTSSPAEAKTWFAALIEHEPVALSVIASVVDSLVAEPARYDNPRWWAGAEGDRVVAAYMHTPPFPLHIAVSTVEQAQTLAERLVDEGYPVPAVGGVRPAAVSFAATWCRLTGAQHVIEMETASFELPSRPRLPFEVEGTYRHATPEDLPLVDGWMRDFHEEALPGGPPAATMAPHVAGGRLGLWVVGGTPVSMAFASVANGGVTRVSGVWTPPDRRGNGYASAVVAALSNDRMDRGERCMLYTDLSNPTSNAIYRALGYRRVGEAVTIRFT